MNIFDQYPILLPSVVIAVLAIVKYLVDFGEWKGKINESRKSLEGFDKWKGEVDSERTSFKEFMKEIREKIDKIFERLPANTLLSSSPLRLADLGEKVSERIGAAGLAAGLSDALFTKVKDKSPYEVQQFCLDYVKQTDRSKRFVNWTPDQVLKFSDCAYDNGIPIEQVLDVIGIELRDKLIELKAAADEHG